MQCQIISIGDELLIGDTLNTNAGWIGQTLTEAGVEVTYIHTIGDDLTVMKKVLRQTLSSSDLVITTGGLGPTHDDITKQAVTELFDCKLVVHQPTLDFIKKRFKKRGIPFSKSNFHQAEVPDCCEVLFNTQGTAPGMWFDRGNCKLAVLPGIPNEMEFLMKKEVLPRVKKPAEKAKIHRSRYIITAGVGESTLSDEIIGDLSNLLNENIKVAWLPDVQGEKIRITASGFFQQEVDERLEKAADFIKKRAGDVFVGEGKELTLAEALGNLLTKKNCSIATAESCTGGLVSSMITDIPGSSRYMKGGIVAYSNEVKINQLGVKPQTLENFGAVSKLTALEMAKGVTQKLGADIGISATGIAGPGGGSKEKPVGLVWIGFYSKEQHFALKAQFSSRRSINKARTAVVAMEMVRRCLLQINEMPYSLKKHTA
ncbi:MAG TPA: competence/damage-inducible protein A [Balneolaceae bacterium]